MHPTTETADAIKARFVAAEPPFFRGFLTHAEAFPGVPPRVAERLHTIVARWGGVPATPAPVFHAALMLSEAEALAELKRWIC